MSNDNVKLAITDYGHYIGKPQGRSAGILDRLRVPPLLNS